MTGSAFADQITSQGIGPFAGLNTNSDPKAISASQSPDLLNVDIGNGGTSVKKRQGYGLDATMTFSTGPVHNLYKFFDSSGNEVRLAFNDVKVNASVNGSAWSVVLTTGITSGATWDCTDYLGFAYCVSSAFDCPIKTNGTSAGTTGVCGTNLVPQGSLISNSGDRLLVGATSANPSRLYYSQSAVVTNFALGVQPSDSSFEDIVAPGSKLTHLAYRFGRWLWWKDQSFGFTVGTGQFDLQIVTVSNTIGTLDNTDVFDGNYVYFRGSDAQIYTYDGSVLSRAISSDIAPTLRTANKRKANLWTQTTQADFQTGSIVPTGQLSTTINAGSVVPSSATTTYYLTASSYTLNAQTINNFSFESGQSTNWTAGTGWSNQTSLSRTCGTISAQDGTKYEAIASNSITAKVVNGQTGVLISSIPVTGGTECTWTATNLTLPTSSIGIPGAIVFDSGIYQLWSDTFTLNGNTVQFYANFGHTTGPTLNYIFIDDIASSPKASSGTFTSSVYDLGITSSTAQIQAAWTPASATGAFVLLGSTATTGNSTGAFATVLTSTGTNSGTNRFVKLVSTLTFTTSDIISTTATIVASSTGTFYSAVNNAPNLTSFSTVGMTDSVGNSTITYYVRGSSNSFTVLSSTPAWVLQAKNGTANISFASLATATTYFQLRADFSITAATETPTLSDFTFNWYEGSAADKMYGTYFNNAIWFSLSLGTSTTTNNRIARYDLLSNVWTVYDITANGFLTYNNNLYFGDPTAGRVFQFGNNVYSDNGTAISAYWKSKPFFGDSPFSEKDLRMGSWLVASDSGTTLTVTYTLDESTNTVIKNINLYDSRKGMIRNNYNFPAGTIPTVFSAKVGDNSTNPPWEVFGGLVTFVPKPIVVTP